MSYRRGFKAEADWYARELRADFGLQAHDPLCPWQLSKHLGYRIICLSDYLKEASSAVLYLQSAKGQREFSAVTMCLEGLRWIVHNDFHHPHRQASNLSHELAHGVLHHKPVALVGENGARIFNREEEDEANWLGPALLISAEAALHIAKSGQSHSAFRAIYSVTNEVLQMRLRVSGALIRATRAA